MCIQFIWVQFGSFQSNWSSVVRLVQFGQGWSNLVHFDLFNPVSVKCSELLSGAGLFHFAGFEISELQRCLNLLKGHLLKLQAELEELRKERDWERWNRDFEREAQTSVWLKKKKKRGRKFGYRYCFSPKKRNEEIEILRETFITKRERDTHKLYIGTVWFLESFGERENFHKEFHFLLFGANSLVCVPSLS